MVVPHSAEGAWETPSDERIRVCVLGGFQLTEGSHRLGSIPAGSQRLLAFLAFRPQPTSRQVTASSLWPDTSERHAAGNLRSALSRLDSTCRNAVTVSASDLELAAESDLRSARDLANRLLGGAAPVTAEDVGTEAIDRLSSEVLPGWYDEWVLVVAEDWRQLRLHALEALAERLTQSCRFSDAVRAAMTAVRADPLRESAHGALMRVHLAEGNQTEAISEFNRYRELLRDSLGLEPTARLVALLDGCVTDRAS